MQSALRHIDLLTYFFDNPYEQIHLRGISRKKGINVYTVKEALDDMVAEGLLTESSQGNLRLFKANTSDQFFRMMKSAFSVKKITDSGLIPHIISVVPAASSITLFGSVAKGLDAEGSDLDLLVIGQKPRDLDTSSFEAKIGRRIEVTCITWSDWSRASREDKAFYTEVITGGISLYGELPVVD